MYFVTQEGEPCDAGALALEIGKNLPKLKRPKVGDINVTAKQRGFNFALILKENKQTTLNGEDFDKCLIKLGEQLAQLQLKTVSIATSKEIEGIPFNEVTRKFSEMLQPTLTKLIVCLNKINIPRREERSKIIEEAHASCIGGHKGIVKTFHRIRQKYYWAGLKRDIQSHVQQCLTCQLKKLVRVKTKQPMVITDTPGSAFDVVAIDLVGPLPATSKGSISILTIQCTLTKYCLAVPLKQTRSSDVADALVKRLICTFGAPRAIPSDQGTNLTSSLMKLLAKRFKIERFSTSAFHPQANGSLERTHIVLKEYLKVTVGKNEDWDDYIEMAMFSYNSSWHSASRYTPHELVFGRPARLPSSHPPTEEEKLPTYEGYLEDLIVKLNKVRENARNNLINAKIKSKVYYDRDVNEKSFAVGSSVFLLNEAAKTFGNNYKGPFEIVEVLPRGNVRIRHKKNRTKVVHMNRLKHSHINSA